MDKIKKFEQGIAGARGEYEFSKLEMELGESVLLFMRKNNIKWGRITLDGPTLEESPLFGTHAYMTIWLEYCQE